MHLMRNNKSGFQTLKQIYSLTYPTDILEESRNAKSYLSN